MPTATRKPPARSADLESDAAALQAAVSELVRVYQFRDRDRICCHDVSVTQCYALETLVEHGPMRPVRWPSGCSSTRAPRAGSSATLVKKGYVEQRADEADGRATALQVTATGRRLYKRITADLVEQQKQLLQDLDPEVREGVVRVIRGLARAADSRFRSGVSVGPGGGCCAPGPDGSSSATDFFTPLVVTSKYAVSRARSNRMRHDSLPVVIIGAGPVGTGCRCPCTVTKPHAAGARGGALGRRRHPAVGPRAHVLAVEVQRRFGGGSDPRATGLVEAGRRRLPDGPRSRRALPDALGTRQRARAPYPHQRAGRQPSPGRVTI